MAFDMVDGQTRAIDELQYSLRCGSYGQPYPRSDQSESWSRWRSRRRTSEKFIDKQHLQSMAQAVHAFDLNMRIVFWNAMAEKLYGYSAAKQLGRKKVKRALHQQGESSTILSEGGSGDSHQSDHSVFGATHSDHRDDAASSGANGILMWIMMRREKRDSRHFKRMRNRDSVSNEEAQVS
ncbi:hypothetical protein F2Q68_00018171 [Brassica cretica]|uniref:PAS domain-containing protein n=1 Tax=Brassica cretica TaxID=69181 RepID=A0A8S9HPZ0_BRACR|nr:hypothetical protein F2Q68_00018171 [Brassica cretica]